MYARRRYLIVRILLIGTKKFLFQKESFVSRPKMNSLKRLTHTQSLIAILIRYIGWVAFSCHFRLFFLLFDWRQVHQSGGIISEFAFLRHKLCLNLYLLGTYLEFVVTNSTLTLWRRNLMKIRMQLQKLFYTNVLTLSHDACD